MKKGLVSILVPIYNVQKFLPDCLKSIEEQTYKDIEVIFVNDGSTDNSKNILENFCSRHINAKIINQKNMGLPSARNTAIKNMHGEFFYILDSDDVMNINTISAFIKAQSETQADVVTANFSFIQENEEFSKKMSKQIRSKYKIINGFDLCCATYLSNYKSDFTRMCWNKLCKTSILKQIENYPDVWDPTIVFGEDTYFMCRYLPLCNKACCIHDKTYFYRKRSSSISKEHFNEKMLHLFKSVSPIDKLNEAEFPKSKINQKSFLCQTGNLVITKMFSNKYRNIENIEYSYRAFKGNLKFARRTYNNFWVRLIGIVRPFVFIMYKHLLRKSKKQN